MLSRVLVSLRSHRSAAALAGVHRSPGASVAAGWLRAHSAVRVPAAAASSEAGSGAVDASGDAAAEVEMMDLTVRDIMEWISKRDGAKAPVRTASPHDPVFDVVTTLFEDNASSVVVVDDDKIKGTFYDRDYVMRLSHGAQPAYNVHIKDIMNTSVTSATPDAPLTDAVWGMADTFFLPVMKTSVATDEIECLQEAEAEAEAEADVDSAADQVDKTAADAALAAAKDSTDSVDAAEDRKDGKDDSKLEPANVADDAAADANLGALPLSALSTMLTLNDVLAFLVAHVDTRSSSKSSKDDSKTQGEADSADERLFKVRPHAALSTTVMDIVLKSSSRIILNTQVDDAVSAADAANAMANSDMSCVIIVDGNGRLQGLFTALDFLTRVVVPEKDATKTQVTDMMSTPVVTVEPSSTVLDCAKAMVRANVRHMPVVAPDSGICVGVLSQAQLLKTLFPQPAEAPSFWKLRSYFRLVGSRD